MITQACIFDLDGVIVDTARYHFLAWKRLAVLLQIHFTKSDNERLKGVSRMDSLDIILEIGRTNLSDDLKKEYATLKNQWYIDYINKMTPDEILPGALKFIKEVKSAGIRVAVGSASRNTPLILRRTGLETIFDAVADGNVVSKTKPDPEVFIKVSEMLGVDPWRCVVFEDAVAGVQAALNAEMMCVGIGSKYVLTDAHYVISGLDKMNLKKLEKVEKLSDHEQFLQK